MKKVIFTILDGFGIRAEKFGNAVLNAHTPAIDKLFKEFPNSTLNASGESVGLPAGQMGNSEVGHITIGSGRVVDQPLHKINKSLEDGSFYENKELLKVIDYTIKNKTSLHILGLLSDGGVHSHIKHIFALIKMAKARGIKSLYVHAFLDGRDVPYKSAEKYLNMLEDYLKNMGIGKISTVSGRYYAMDRERDWTRTKLCYDALINGKGNKYTNYRTLLADSYNKGVFDEFVEPTIINEEGIIKDGDGLIFANYRPDRIPQLGESIVNNNFEHFPTKKYSKLRIVTMMPVSKTLNVPSAFDHDIINNTLGEVLSNKCFKVLRIAETSKYPHVTHFIDGDKDVDLKYTSKKLIPRKNVETYDLEPSMSAEEVTDEIIKSIDNYDFVVVNYANGDMVGHTGNYEAAIKAVEELDKCVSRLYNLAFKKDIILIITADHGNCEEMVDKKGLPHTYHTTNKVPLIVCDKNYEVGDGSLYDIAPSILGIMGIEPPSEMTGSAIIKEIK